MSLTIPVWAKLIGITPEDSSDQIREKVIKHGIIPLPCKWVDNMDELEKSENEVDEIISQAARIKRPKTALQALMEGFKDPDPTKAVKFDHNKPRVELMPPDALEDVARVFSLGAQKYGVNNWRKGMKWSRLYAATIRHLWAWFCGQDRDPETGLRHLSHAACNVLFLISYDQHNLGEDDRWTKAKQEIQNAAKNDE